MNDGHRAWRRRLPAHGGAARWAVLLLGVAAGVAACGSGGSSSPTAQPTSHTTPSASATPRIVGSQRTVLSPLGLNVHSDASSSAAVVGTAAWGVSLTVLDYRSDNGGWYKVQGQTTTGWIVADPTLTAQGTFQSYSSTERGFGALIPDTWTFAEETADVVFRPQSGQQTIVVRTGPNSTALGSEQPPGYAPSASSQQLVVCGYTGQLDYYSTNGSTAPSASPSASGSPASSAQHLTDYAAIRLRFDSAHTMEIAFNYQTKDQLPVFEAFYNSITFPFPLCQAPLPSPSGAPPA